MGAAWVTRLTNFRTQWTTNLDAQSGSISRLEGARTDLDASWETLSWAFFDIVHQLFVDNPRNPAVANQYFNFSIFGSKTSSSTDGVGTLRILVLTAAGEPLVNAYVEITDQNNQIIQTGSTNNGGFFESDEIALGFYDVLAKQNGYVPKIMQFQVLDDSSPDHEIRLSSE